MSASAAAVSELAVSMLESEDVAESEARGPVGSASETTAAARLLRLLFSPANSPAWVDRIRLLVLQNID